jgi:hypothetical protein
MSARSRANCNRNASMLVHLVLLGFLQCLIMLRLSKVICQVHGNTPDHVVHMHCMAVALQAKQSRSLLVHTPGPGCQTPGRSRGCLAGSHAAEFARLHHSCCYATGSHLQAARRGMAWRLRLGATSQHAVHKVVHGSCHAAPASCSASAHSTSRAQAGICSLLVSQHVRLRYRVLANDTVQAPHPFHA